MSINAVSNNFMASTVINTGISRTENSEASEVVGAKRHRPIEKVDVEYPEDKQLSQEEAIDAIEKANKNFITFDRRFEFSIHEKTKQIMVKVIDVSNDQVIRELPPEKILDMVAAIWEVAGIMIDTKA